MRRNLAVYFILLLTSTAFSYGVDLTIEPKDLRLVAEYTSNRTGTSTISGYHLFVRKKPEIESVLLTETIRDPAMKETNYAYRALEWNAINGNELRYLDGGLLTEEYARFSIIDSTPEPDEQFGSAFHLYIPNEMIYGYPWTRNGIVQIGQDTFLNIRAFGAKYGDYTDGFEDNPFTFDFVVAELPPEPLPLPEPLPPPAPPPRPQTVINDKYNSDAVNTFASIANFNNGNLFYSNGPDQLSDDIIQSVHAIPDKTRADIVFAIDATGSMKDDLAQLRRELKDRLKTEFELFGPVRLGLVFYRDYGDDFNFQGLPVKMFPFTADLEEFNRNLDSIVITGVEGGDRPEAVYEALYAALDYYSWSNSTPSRKVILIGDAEPHLTPRGSGQYTKEMVQQLAQYRNVITDVIILPDGM
jgi:hypothetical protein